MAFAIGGVLLGSIARWGRLLPHDRRTAASAASLLVALGLAGPVRAQNAEDNLGAEVSINTFYDSNVLRTTAARGYNGPTDNVRITPQVRGHVRRTIGRTTLAAGASVGYDFNSRFKFLNQVRVAVTGNAAVPITATCFVRPSVSYQRLQADLGDLTTIRNNTAELISYAAGISCNREFGFSPYLEVRQDTGTNTDPRRLTANYRSRSVTAGVDYNKPSLGTVRLFGTYRKIDRPKLQELLGISDGAEVKSAGIELIRDVAPRLSGTLSASIVDVSPVRNNVSGYTGAGYSVELNYRPSPRLSIVGVGSRSITSETSISATYSVTDILRVSPQLRVSPRSVISGSAAYIHRGFRGENVVPGFIPRGADTTTEFGGAYRFALRQRLTLGVDIAYRRRRSDNSFFNYSSLGGGGSVTVRF